MKKIIAFIFGTILFFGGCENTQSAETDIAEASTAADESLSVSENTYRASAKTGIITEQILNGGDGEIHYSYYLPDNYDSEKKYPLIMAMPGYDRMWFGEQSSGSNLDWNGFLCWTELDEDMIVVSAQFTDWGEKSARQSNELEIGRASCRERVSA